MAGKWIPRTVTVALWALAALCASFWSLRLVGSGSTDPAIPATAATAPTADPADLARALGPPVPRAEVAVASAPATVDPASRYLLVGVVASKSSKGVALIAVDGKAARPYRIGSPVADNYILKSVQGRTAVLGSDAPATPALTLQLAAPGSTPSANASAQSLPPSQALPNAQPLPPAAPASAGRIPLGPARSLFNRPVG